MSLRQQRLPWQPSPGPGTSSPVPFLAPLSSPLHCWPLSPFYFHLCGDLIKVSLPSNTWDSIKVKTISGFGHHCIPCVWGEAEESIRGLVCLWVTHLTPRDSFTPSNGNNDYSHNGKDRNSSNNNCNSSSHQSSAHHMPGSVLCALCTLCFPKMATAVSTTSHVLLTVCPWHAPHEMVVHVLSPWT